jgi:hypothetical protein
VRSTRKVTLTETGQQFLVTCRRVLGELGEAEKLASGEYHAPGAEVSPRQWRDPHRQPRRARLVGPGERGQGHERRPCSISTRRSTQMQDTGGAPAWAAFILPARSSAATLSARRPGSAAGLPEPFRRSRAAVRPAFCSGSLPLVFFSQFRQGLDHLPIKHCGSQTAASCSLLQKILAAMSQLRSTRNFCHCTNPGGGLAINACRAERWL